MAIKVGLEKAYDRLNWDFMADTLKDIRLSDRMTDMIMKCVNTCRMNVIWNGDTTEEFPISREIRQGGPLSPYLFVLCTERLSHIIEYAITRKKWKPIKLNKKGPNNSHIFFVDDLFLFAELDLEQVQTIQTCLDIFCKASGKKINKEKTHMFC